MIYIHRPLMVIEVTVKLSVTINTLSVNNTEKLKFTHKSDLSKFLNNPKEISALVVARQQKYKKGGSSPTI